MVRFILFTGLFIAGLIAWFIVKAIRLNLAVTRALHTKLQPVLAPIAADSTPPVDQIHSLAARADTRSTLYRSLRDLKRADLFPSSYATPEQLAESDLVVWLMHGNELGAAPDAIELVKAIDEPASATSAGGRYFVFRFRTNPPHWASKNGWMAGVAGPYFAGDEAFDAPAAGVFSRFEAFDSRSADDHLAAIRRQVRQ